MMMLMIVTMMLMTMMMRAAYSPDWLATKNAVRGAAGFHERVPLTMAQ